MIVMFAHKTNLVRLVSEGHWRGRKLGHTDVWTLARNGIRVNKKTLGTQRLSEWDFKQYLFVVLGFWLQQSKETDFYWRFMYLLLSVFWIFLLL